MARKSYLPLRLTSRGKRGRRGNEASVAAATYVVVFLVCGILLLIALTRIYLERQTVELGRIHARKERELELVEKEHGNLLVQRANLRSADYIIRRTRQLRLGLGPSDPGQVREMPPRADRVESVSQRHGGGGR